MSDDTNISKIKDFFKSNVIIDDLAEVLEFRPDQLIGIDKVHSERLAKADISKIGDLAKLNPDNPPTVSEILPQILIKWIKIGKVLEKAVKEQIKEQKKLLMIGLDNGGKTSLLAVLQKKFSIIKDLLPTRGVKREKLDFFGYPIISWDLGGQVQYRENLYFNKPELFFSEVDLILYVVDTQDAERFTESANYFRQVLKVLDDLNEHPPIMIVLNKSDQDIRKTLQWQKNVQVIKNKFNLIINEKQSFNVSYEDTSIFDKTSILTMFSLSLKQISDTSEIIEHILEDFVGQIDGKGASLISLDGLIFGSYTRNETDEMVLNNTALLLQTLSNFHSSVGLIREKALALEFPLNDFVIRGEKLFDYSELQIPVYLWLIAKDLSMVESKLTYFKDQLVPLINLFV